MPEAADDTASKEGRWRLDAAGREYCRYTGRQRWEIDAEKRAKVARSDEREARRVAGLGFGRLVWIVAIGMMIAHGALALVSALFRALAG